MKMGIVCLFFSISMGLTHLLSYIALSGQLGAEDFDIPITPAAVRRVGSQGAIQATSDRRSGSASACRPPGAMSKKVPARVLR